MRCNRTAGVCLISHGTDHVCGNSLRRNSKGVRLLADIIIIVLSYFISHLVSTCIRGCISAVVSRVTYTCIRHFQFTHRHFVARYLQGTDRFHSFAVIGLARIGQTGDCNRLLVRKMEYQGCRNVMVVIGRNGYCAFLIVCVYNIRSTGICELIGRIEFQPTIQHRHILALTQHRDHSSLRCSLREKVCCRQSTGLCITASFDKIYRLADCSGVGSFINGEFRTSADIIVSTCYIRNCYSSGASIDIICIGNSILTGKNHICSVLYNHSRFLRRTIVGYGSRDFNGRSGNRLLFNGIDDPCGLIPHRNFSPISAGILRYAFHLLE